MNEITQRLIEIFDENQQAKTLIAKKLDCSPQYVSNLYAGRNIPSIEILNKIHKEYNVSIDWLITGEGEKTLNKKSTDEIASKGQLDNLKDEIIELYRFLAEKGLKFERRVQIGG